MRFIGRFMVKITKFCRKAVNMLIETFKVDVRSVAGKNCRYIMLLDGKPSVQDLRKEDADTIDYFPLDEKGY